MANTNPPHVLLNEEYTNPVIHRMPSPTSSIGTVYGLDETVHSDKLSDVAFAKKCDEQMELCMLRTEEIIANQDPLLVIPQSGGIPVGISERQLDPLEERLLYDHVMGNLRRAVAQLEENELFEQTVRRGSQAALEIQPSTNDIDTLMRSMMGPSMNITAGRPYMGVSVAPPLRGRKAVVDPTKGVGS